MNWLPLDSLTEWENTWVWLKVVNGNREYVYYTPICVCRYPKGRVIRDDNWELNPNIHTIQVIQQPSL